MKTGTNKLASVIVHLVFSRQQSIV